MERDPGRRVLAVLFAAAVGNAVLLLALLGEPTGWRGPRDAGFVAVAVGFAGAFGALTLLRNRAPRVALVAAILTVCGYYIAGLPSIGHPGVTLIRNASSNYMVQDVCFFLQELGVEVDGIGTTTLTVRGLSVIDTDVAFAPSEDPIEAMSLLTAAIVTGSELTVQRCPIEFLEIELAILAEMGLDFDLSPEYPAENGKTRLVDITVHPSELRASSDKIHPMPFPGLNIDNLPFFAVIAAVAQGRTMIHDWVYENRAIHLVELTKLGANVQLLDPHRIIVTGPTRWRGQEVISPPALRPAVCLLLAALAARGTSVLRDVYVINRGYEDLPNRLNALGAKIEVFRD